MQVFCKKISKNIQIIQRAIEFSFHLISEVGVYLSRFDGIVTEQILYVSHINAFEQKMCSKAMAQPVQCSHGINS